MRLRLLLSLALIPCLIVSGGCQEAPPAPETVATGNQGMIATVHPVATEAGLAAIERGGNAVDAAIAAAFMLGVVDGHNSGIGGGCFILIRKPSGEILAIDGREMAPARAYREMFLQGDKPQPLWSRQGALAVGVPGALAGYALALEMAGKLDLARIIEPAARVANSGFVIDSYYGTKLLAEASILKRDPSAKRLFFHEDGSVLKAGERLFQRDLARTYRQIARHGIRWFYEGPFAQTLEKWMDENGGLMTAQDLAEYRPVVRQPIRSSYRGLEIIGFPPPSSGGIHVAQILNILETFDLEFETELSATHLTVEAMKRAFADRAFWLGDPAFAPVPMGLVSKSYAKKLAETIDRQRSDNSVEPGNPPGAETHFFPKHTTHIAAADAEGYWVAITTTVNTTFGAKVVLPGTGVILNNQMDDFSLAPGQPNAFGLVGAEANAIQPGKRPLSSMSPTIVLRDGEPFLTLGAAGGPTIITQVVNTILRHSDQHMTLPEAVAAPRFHHQWRPNRLFVEGTLSDKLQGQLEGLGHLVQVRDFVGVTQAIERTPEGKFIGVHDPRVPGKAEGW